MLHHPEFALFVEIVYSLDFLYRDPKRLSNSYRPIALFTLLSDYESREQKIQTVCNVLRVLMFLLGLSLINLFG